MTREQHIFVVDDDPDIRELLSDYLRRHGFATSSAGDAREFFRLLPGTPCDLVVECQHVVHPPLSLEAGGFLPRAVCGRTKL